MGGVGWLMLYINQSRTVNQAPQIETADLHIFKSVIHRQWILGIFFANCEIYHRIQQLSLNILSINVFYSLEIDFCDIL